MSLRHLCAGGVVAAVALCPLARADEAPATPSPAEMLVTAADAARTQNFQGVLIYRDDRSLEAMRVMHRFRDGHESERVTSLNGEPRDIFREDDRVYCVLPKDRRLSMARPALKGFLSQLTPDRLAQLSAWYEFKPLGSERVAARNCVGVAVMPRDQYRYGYELWTDEQTHVPLKFNLLSSDRHVLEQVMFTEVSFPASIPDAAFHTDINTAQSQLVPRSAVEAVPMTPLAGGSPQWVFDNLPPGFRVVMHDEGELPDGSGRVVHTLLTDGLSTISVFGDEVRGRDTGLQGLSHMGSVQLYGRVVGSFHVTVVGDAPALTMRQIGQGLEPAPGSAATPAGGATAVSNPGPDPAQHP